MLIRYIEAAMDRATYKQLEDGEWFAEIPELPGVYGTGTTVEAARKDLFESLQEWIVLGLSLGHTLPAIDGVELTIPKSERVA